MQNKDRDQTGNFRNLFNCSKYDLILIVIIGPPGDHERPSDASQRPSPHANTSTNWGQGSHGRRTYVKVKGYLVKFQSAPPKLIFEQVRLTLTDSSRPSAPPGAWAPPPSAYSGYGAPQQQVFNDRHGIVEVVLIL